MSSLWSPLVYWENILISSCLSGTIILAGVSGSQTHLPGGRLWGFLPGSQRPPDPAPDPAQWPCTRPCTVATSQRCSPRCARCWSTPSAKCDTYSWCPVHSPSAIGWTGTDPGHCPVPEVSGANELLYEDAKLLYKTSRHPQCPLQRLVLENYHLQGVLLYSGHQPGDHAPVPGREWPWGQQSDDPVWGPEFLWMQPADAGAVVM